MRAKDILKMSQKKPGTMPAGAPRSFLEASKEIQDNLQKHLDQLAGDGATISDDEEEEEEVADDLLEKVLSGYSGGDAASARAALRTALQPLSCLICIEPVRKVEAIWSCGTCYVSFHIVCIQKWAKDSLFQQRQQQEEAEAMGLATAGTGPARQVKVAALQWSCPKCRSGYGSGSIPSRYLCYCGKESDPVFDPWLAPHSCGEKCGRPLQPACSHKCIILCHPGPCPPCPQTVRVSCYCGQSSPTVRRCSAAAWACSKPCGRLLACGIHPCTIPCHPGECPPCAKTSIQSCVCGRTKEPRACATPVWVCGTPCGKSLGCGYHSCTAICHPPGECPPCPLSQVRHCPCGKRTDYVLPCTVATPCCGDTCGKLLLCKSHYCAERCHRGNCPSCLQMTVKSCRCGAKKKEVQCAKSFTCDVKCKRTRDCQRHACNKKCCEECAPCEQMCGKTLNCKNHKCMSRCHQGPCYPCTGQSQVACNCGATSLTVPCGRERTSRPPRCRKLCTVQPDCHHTERIRHNCHSGSCPPCRQVCGQPLVACGHLCPAACHDQVTVRVEEQARPVGPWEERGPSYVTKQLPCPPCRVPVPVACLGKHEVADWPCHEAKPASCGRLCGRLLACTNHTCERDCHKVRHAADDVSAGINCKKCESECLKPRPPGCSHACPNRCHPGSCPPCEVNLKLKCHCGINNLYLKCFQFTTSSQEERTASLSCTDQCPKVLSCGHRCTLICHEGPCAPIADCKKKVKVTCPCKRRKEEFRCFNINTLEVALACDADCDAQRQAAEEERRRRTAQDQGHEESELSRREAELFEKRQQEGGGAKRRRRNRRTECQESEDSGSWVGRYRLPMACLAVAAIAVLSWHLVYNADH